jgi:hypothetical protein
VAGKSDRSIRKALSDIAVSVGPMADMLTATKAGDVPQGIAMGHSIAVDFFNLWPSLPGK